MASAAFLQVAETTYSTAFILLCRGFRQSDDRIHIDALLFCSALCSDDDCPALRTDQEQAGTDRLGIALPADRSLYPVPSRLCRLAVGKDGRTDGKELCQSVQPAGKQGDADTFRERRNKVLLFLGHSLRGLRVGLFREAADRLPMAKDHSQ